MTAALNHPIKLLDIAETILSLAKKQGAMETEVAVRTEKGFDIAVRHQDIETLEHHQGQSVEITVYIDHKKGAASCSSFDTTALTEAVSKAICFADYTSIDPAAGLPDKSDCQYTPRHIQLMEPWPITIDQASREAIDCEAYALTLDKRIKQTESINIYSYHTSSILANSHGFLGQREGTTYGKSCCFIAEDDSGMQRDDEWTVARRASDLMPWDQLASKAVEKTVARLNPQKISTRNCPVIFAPSVAKSLFGHFFSAIAGGSLYRKNSFLLNSLGKNIFPEHLSIRQLPFIDFAISSASYDLDGIETKEQFYVKAGIVENYSLDCYAARKLNMQSTGNAGGVFNIHFETPKVSLMDLLKQMNRGLLVTELMGQSVNLITGHYSRGATGFWVENGEIQYPVAEVTVAGKLQNIFKNIVAMADDTDVRSSICSGSVLIADMKVAGQ
ncbi:MAG: hypothetical protein A3F17_02575 [Gammaproteobacteria bacterium RIFCSPHIGHO2_12_FULL_41_15]|nr:MAG: hypothetical protein A3F17_02575 [Gammaproteobacteria bacterium RIFCSPHIGHO2_12_FULL_41_15]